MNRVTSVARVAAVLLLLTGGCSRTAAPPVAPPLAGASIGGPFSLMDQHGRPVTERSFAGRYRIMYFGYTFCPDVCPTDVAAIGAGLKKVAADHPALAARIVPVFVTVDPERDTPAVVGQFVSHFHPRMVGLTGTPAQVAAAAKGYGVFFHHEPPTAGGGYMVSHSRQTYLMDPDGKPLALIPADKGADAVAAELERWVT